jgi:hypothetical protein
MLLSHCKTSSFTPTQNSRQNYSSVYIDVYIFDSKLEDKRWLGDNFAFLGYEAASNGNSLVTAQKNAVLPTSRRKPEITQKIVKRDLCIQRHIEKAIVKKNTK